MNLTQWLFDSSALKICPEDSPFWYTSGTIGPYYINTHFLCGGERAASAILGEIDEALAADRLTCPERVGKALEAEIAKEGIFARVVEMLVRYIEDNIPLDTIGYLSGGERRDWFFSLPVASRLGLPHISIFKDMSCALSDGVKHYPLTKIEGGKTGVLHIADLITEASSYERAWVPAIEALGGRIEASVVVIDRMQGGGEKLRSLGVEHHALAAIDMGLFETALEQELMTLPQYKMVSAFIDNPHDSMREFLMTHPDFLRASLTGDERTAGRAKLCLEKDVYGIAEMFK